MKNITLIIFLISSLFGKAQIENLRQRYFSLKSLSGEFIETLKFAEGVDTQIVFEGRFVFQSPGNFRLDVTKPIPQLIISRDSTLLFYFPKEKRLVYQSSTYPFPFLTFLQPLFDTTARIIEEENGKELIILIENQEGSFFTNMRLRLDKTKTKIEAFSFVDNCGNRYQFILKNQQWNKTIPPKTFEFTPPSGTSIEYQ
ncbi:MAG: outer membrane lipoprotein carrier protein LolA [Candidatus Jordarchaeaceae archaeon]